MRLGLGCNGQVKHQWTGRAQAPMGVRTPRGLIPLLHHHTRLQRSFKNSGRNWRSPNQNRPSVQVSIITNVIIIMIIIMSNSSIIIIIIIIITSINIIKIIFPSRQENYRMIFRASMISKFNLIIISCPHIYIPIIIGALLLSPRYHIPILLLRVRTILSYRIIAMKESLSNNHTVCGLLKRFNCKSFEDNYDDEMIMMRIKIKIK